MMSAQTAQTAQTAQPAFDLAGWSQHHLDRVEQALGRWVGHGAPAGLGEAMRYAVLDGGKRLRPLLVLAARQAVAAADAHDATARAGHDEAALRAACAVELIHAYSLVHDDMPCMDNDVLRRGKPTVHVRFGQARALLAGDALQALAFELLTPEDGVPPAMQARLCRLLAQAAGADGMAEVDAGEGDRMTLTLLNRMSRTVAVSGGEMHIRLTDDDVLFDVGYDERVRKGSASASLAGAAAREIEAGGRTDLMSNLYGLIPGLGVRQGENLPWDSAPDLNVRGVGYRFRQP